jgi:hypothetical protein
MVGANNKDPGKMQMFKDGLNFFNCFTLCKSTMQQALL